MSVFIVIYNDLTQSHTEVCEVFSTYEKAKKYSLMDAKRIIDSHYLEITPEDMVFATDAQIDKQFHTDIYFEIKEFNIN